MRKDPARATSIVVSLIVDAEMCAKVDAELRRVDVEERGSMTDAEEGDVQTEQFVST